MKCRSAARRTITCNYIGPEIGTSSGKATLTKGVVTGVQLETVLRELSKVQGYHRFDDLPIPFRAVATDLVTGKAVVFSEGELASVMRASMSVPGAVAPAEYGGMILVDGMLTSNLPVEAARAMGADIIIAVNVGTPLLKREQLNSILGVAGQMLSILTEQNVQTSLASLKPTDILISPELGDFSTGDFDNLSITMPIGEAGARKVADRLAQLSLPPAEYAALRKRQQVAMAPSLQPVDEIRFNDLERVNPQAAQAVMQTTRGPAAGAGPDRRRHAAPVRHRRLRARELPHPRGARQARDGRRRRREGLGPELPAPGHRLVQRLLAVKPTSTPSPAIA